MIDHRVFNRDRDKTQPNARSSRVLLDSPDANKWERAHLTKSTTEEGKNERINHR